MNVVDVTHPRARDGGPHRAPAPPVARWVPAMVGATAFWAANLAISMTPGAAAYRSALSIDYVPMLVEAAAGGLVLSGALALVLTRFPNRIPGRGSVRKAVVLAAAVLVLVTLLLELPAKLRSGVADPGYWLVVATAFNAIRILALGAAVGLVTRARHPGPERNHPSTRPEARP